MPRTKSYSSKITSIKDILARAINALNELAQDFSELIADAEKYKEIKPLLDKLAPVEKNPYDDITKLKEPHKLTYDDITKLGEIPPEQPPPQKPDKKKSGKKKKKGDDSGQTGEPNLEP